jgi:hypothetical protein
VTILCYPQRWDSVSFYLPDADVKVFAAKERQSLLDELHRRPRVMLAARSGRALNEIVAGLSEEMEFVAGSKNAAVTVGWVRRRAAPANERFAEMNEPRP